MPNSFYTYEYIDPSECLGDSLNKIRNNDFNASNAIGDLETRITTVSGVLKNQIDLKEKEFTVLPILSGGTGATTAATARTNLGLGSLATLSTITETNITDNAVTNVKIASGLDASKLTIGTLPIARISDGSVTNVKIASGLDASKLTIGTLPIARISDGSVTNVKIASGLDASKLTIGTLPIARISDGSVTLNKLSLPSNFPIQMVQVVKSEADSISTGGVWTDINNLSLTLNRLDTSGKVRVQAVISYSSNNADIQSQFRIVRTSSAVGLGNTSGSRVSSTAAGAYPNSDDGLASVVLDFIDTPSTSSSVIYKIQIRTSSTITAYINRTNNDADTSVFTPRTISTLTLTELAS